MKTISAILLFCVVSSTCFSQQRLRVPAQVCRFDYTTLSDNSDLVVNAPDNRVQQLWHNLLSKSGMTGTNAALQRSTNSRTFESFIQNGRGWIIYDDDVLNQWVQDPNYDWMVTFILAHELAHFALGHNIANGSNKEWEARADEWACQQLCKMQATTDQACKAVLTFVPELGSVIKGYPTKRERVEAIQRYFDANICFKKNNGLVRLDGLYVGTSESHDGEILRFYVDGTVVGNCIGSFDIESLKHFFNMRGNTGVYTITDNKVVMTLNATPGYSTFCELTDKNGVNSAIPTRYYGYIRGNQLDLMFPGNIEKDFIFYPIN